MVIMSEYYSSDLSGYVDAIRARMNEHSGDLTDEEALEIIESYVFSQPKSGGCTHRENGELIRRIYLTLRSEMSILQPYVDDRSISEIMVNGRSRIFAERGGRIERLPASFSSDEELLELIRRIAAGVHREINELNPVVDARLSNGSRVCAAVGSIAAGGPYLTIRKFPDKVMDMEDLIRCGTVTEEAAELLRTLVKARYNCFVSGGTSSGKTTFLNALSRFIPPQERVIVIEDSLELQIDQVENIVRLECRNANIQGKGAIDMAMLVKSSLRMRPDRIIIGEVRGKEVMDMIQAMNTGHDGSMCSGHANSITGMLKRLEAMFLQAADIPLDAVRSQIAEGIDIMIHMSRMRDGSRKVIEIAELDTPRENSIRINSLYRIGSGLSGSPLIHDEKMGVWK